jgi:hypothetical protein
MRLFSSSKLWAVIALLFIGNHSSFGQLQYSMTTLSDANGNPVLMKKAAAGETAHLFRPGYTTAILYLAGNSKPLAGNKFKLNLQQNRLFFLNANGEEMEVTSPVKTIVFTGDPGKDDQIVFEKGFPPIDKLTADNYYQVLVTGKAGLLMDTKFAEVEYKEYNSATTSVRIDKLVSFYGVVAGKMQKLSKAEDILLLLGDKTREVSDYMKKENLKIKKQADLEKLFRFYNELFSKS